MNLSIQEAHSWAETWAIRAGLPVESAEYLAHVKAWRDAWRPERVRLLLVAESHVAEVPGDSNVGIRLPSSWPADLPTGYCRLVYCPGYGENDLCLSRPQHNMGTWQYWDIFGQVAYGERHLQPRRHTTTFDEMLAWKLSTLSRPA